MRDPFFVHIFCRAASTPTLTKRYQRFFLVTSKRLIGSQLRLSSLLSLLSQRTPGGPKPVFLHALSYSSHFAAPLLLLGFFYFPFCLYCRLPLLTNPIREADHPPSFLLIPHLSQMLLRCIDTHQSRRAAPSN